MSLATVEQIQEALKDNETDMYGYRLNLGIAVAVAAAIGKNYQDVQNGYKFKKADIQKYLDRQLDDALGHHLGKGPRPWEIVNITEKLDPEQPWIGIEYETGFETGDEYRKVINYMWFNTTNSCIDGEGGSRYPCELTFAPVNYDVFMSDDNPLDKLYQFMQTNNVRVGSWVPECGGCGDYDCDECYGTDEDDYTDVGTHCNISTPAYRVLDGDKKEDVSRVLNNSLYHMSDAAQKACFGRKPYGDFCTMSSSKDTSGWIEGKLFLSTGDHDTWKNYKQVIGKLAEAQEQLSILASEDKLFPSRGASAGRVYMITNFKKYLLGEDEEMELGWRKSSNHASDYW